MKEGNLQEGYFRQSIIGISWLSGFRISSRIVAFLKIIVLARLLSPAQFGVFGIASLILSLLDVLTETGVNIILIQKKEEVKEYINDAWVVSIARGFLVSGLIIITSPLIAIFFQNDQVYNILFLTSIIPLIKGFINPAIIKYQKNLQFDKEFYLRFTIFLFDSISAIILTFILKDPSGIVFGLIIGALVEVILSFIFISPKPKLLLRKQYIGELISKGKWVNAYVLFNYLASQGDSFIVGKILGSSSLGIYQMGLKLSTLPMSEISDVINKVAFPVFVKIASDGQRLKLAFAKTILFVFVTSFLFGMFLIIIPNEVILFILGNQWSEVIIIIKILALYGVVRAIGSIPSALFLALGKQNYVAAMTFTRLLILSITIIPFTIQWGLVGASYSVFASAVLEIPIILYYIYKVFSSFRTI